MAVGIGNWEGIRGRGKVGGTWMRTMSAPASAREIAMCAPMPRVPPVTTAVRPSREKRAGREGAIVGIGDWVRLVVSRCGFPMVGLMVYLRMSGRGFSQDPALGWRGS